MRWMQVIEGNLIFQFSYHEFELNNVTKSSFYLILRCCIQVNHHSLFYVIAALISPYHVRTI